jgi:hypothetical protein
METASCQKCGKGKAEGMKLSFCGACRSVSYCSRVCQKADWKTHKTICKRLNVGDAKQIVHANHQTHAEFIKQLAELNLSDCENPRVRRFFGLFSESQQGDTDHTVTVREMKKILRNESPQIQQVILLCSFSLLSQLTPSKMLELPTSPLKVVLQFVDASVLSSDDGGGATPLHWLANMSDPSKEHTLENQCILAKQLIEAGANVNARAQHAWHKGTPLHIACSSYNCTNLDFIQLLLDHGANPNARNSLGSTPLFYTMGYAPGAAKFLLTHSDKTDPDILPNDGRSFLAIVRSTIAVATSEARRPHNSNSEIVLFQVKQWEEVEKLLVERGALDCGWRG